MHKSIKTSSILTFLLLLIGLTFHSCQENRDEIPSNNIGQPLAIQSEASIFSNSIKESLGSNNALVLQDVLPESVGSPLFEALVSFKSNTGVLVAFLPLITNDQQFTAGVLIITETRGIRNYTLIERGKLQQIDYSRAGYSIVPLTYANIIVSFDRGIFNKVDADLANIIGAPKTEGKAKAFNIDTEDSEDIGRDWVESSQCYFFFAGTISDPYQYFHSYQCYTEMSWESPAGQSIMLDANGSGGVGGGTYIPNLLAVRSAEEVRIEGIQDPRERLEAQLKYLESYGGEEGKAMANFINELINIPGLTAEEAYEIFVFAEKAYLNLKGRYVMEILSVDNISLILSFGITNSLSTAARQKLQNAIARYATNINPSTLRPLGLGSTGRTVANNLIEQLAKKAAMENPKLGTAIIEGLSDPRWLGWSKMQYTIITSNGVRAVVHYVAKWKNGILEAVDDFKFINW
jgi:hypothetical protein